MDMLDLETVWVTQNGLRNPGQLDEMIDFVENDGFWTQSGLAEYAQSKGLPKAAPMIAISEFEDGKRFIHDGTHRTIATILGHRNYLREDEFTLHRWKYDDYLEINGEAGWFTPFDPRTHIRLPEFNQFKARSKCLFEEVRLGVLNQEDFEALIRSQKFLYCVERSVTTPQSLIESMGLKKRRSIGNEIAQGLQDFVELLKSGEPIPATRVQRIETPDGPMHISTKTTI